MVKKTYYIITLMLNNIIMQYTILDVYLDILHPGTNRYPGHVTNIDQSLDTREKTN